MFLIFFFFSFKSKERSWHQPYKPALQLRPQYCSLPLTPWSLLRLWPIAWVSYLPLTLCVLSHSSRVWLWAALWTVAHQAPQSLGFYRQEYWSGLPCPSPVKSSQPRDWIHASYVSCTGSHVLYQWCHLRSPHDVTCYHNETCPMHQAVWICLGFTLLFLCSAIFSRWLCVHILTIITQVLTNENYDLRVGTGVEGKLLHCHTILHTRLVSTCILSCLHNSQLP